MNVSFLPIVRIIGDELSKDQPFQVSPTLQGEPRLNGTGWASERVSPRRERVVGYFGGGDWPYLAERL